MAVTRKTLVRGALIGAAVGVPLGIGSGIVLGHLLLGDDLSGRGPYFIAFVTFAFVAWSAFLGAMLKLQADEPT